MKKIMLLFFTLPFIINATVIQRIADDDLPSEVVAPKLDSPDAVQRKLVDLKNRIELGVTFASVLNEPYSIGKGFNFSLGYHLTDNSSIHVKYTSWIAGDSDYTTQISQANASLAKLSQVPQASSAITLNGEYAFYYGKISLDRSLIFRTTMFVESGIGQSEYGGQNLMGIHLGFGQKIFYNNNFAFRVAIDLQNQQVPNPYSSGLDLSATAPNPTDSDFDITSRNNAILSGGIIGAF